MRVMSGSGPFGPIFNGVWQSLQPPAVTRYLPRSTGDMAGAAATVFSGGGIRCWLAGAGRDQQRARDREPNVTGMVHLGILLKIKGVDYTVFERYNRRHPSYETPDAAPILRRRVRGDAARAVAGERADPRRSLGREHRDAQGDRRGRPAVGRWAPRGASARWRSLLRGSRTTRKAPIAAMGTATRRWLVAHRRRRRRRAIRRSSRRSIRPRASRARRRSRRAALAMRRTIDRGRAEHTSTCDAAARAADRREPRRRLHGLLLQQRRGDGSLLSSARSAATPAAGSTDPSNRRRRWEGAAMARFEVGRRHHRRRHHGARWSRRSSRSSARTGPIIVVEAGKRLFDFENRFEYRQRNLDYGENMWPGDFVGDQAARGVISRTMAVGGSALHWGGVCNRFSEEDTRLKSMYGLAVDWPHRLEGPREVLLRSRAAHRRLGRAEPARRGLAHRAVSDAGDADDLQPDPAQGVGARRAASSSGRRRRRRTRSRATAAAASAGAATPARSVRPARATRPTSRSSSCSPRRRSSCTTRRWCASSCSMTRRAHRVGAGGARKTGRTTASSTARATFVIASGYCWSSHLLLAVRELALPERPREFVRSRRPLHDRPPRVSDDRSISISRSIPGMNEQHSLISRQFFRCRPDQPYVRHDLRVWESASGRAPQLRDGAGKLLLGDALLTDWRTRTTRGTRACAATTTCIPTRTAASRSTPRRRTAGAIRCRRIQHKVGRGDAARAAATREHFQNLFAQLAKANDGRMGNLSRPELSGSSRRRLPHGRGSGHERRRQLRPHARSREPLRRRLADAADGRLHERHADVRGADAAIGVKDRRHVEVPSYPSNSSDRA